MIPASGGVSGEDGELARGLVFAATQRHLVESQIALIASNAALADALGLLRALTTDQDIGDGPAYDVISTPQMRGDVFAARAFLAKHGPSP